MAQPAAAPFAAHDPAPAPAAQGDRLVHRLTLATTATLNGKEVAAVKIAGRWTLTPLRGGRTLAQLESPEVSLVGTAAPDGAALSQPFVLHAADGVLDRIAFAPGTPAAVKELLTSVAVLTQYTDRPGDHWTAAERDLSGVYEACYTRLDGHLSRSRSQYLSLHQLKVPAGTRSGEVLLSDEHARFDVDGQGLTAASVQLNQTAHLGQGVPQVDLRAQATLLRQSSERVALEDGPAFDPEEIRSHLDPAASERRQLEQRVGGASAQALLDSALAATQLDPLAAASRRERHRVLDQLQAKVQLDPAAAHALAGGLQDHKADPRFADLVSGALAGAGTPEATDALASVLDASWTGEPRLQVISSLGLTPAPTARSVAVLKGALDQEQGLQAALALGLEAQSLGDEAGKDAIDALLQRYAQAQDPQARRVYLLALGNTASRRVLQALEDTIAGPDYGLAEVATYGLRMIPGDDVDAVLDQLIGRGSTVTVAAIKSAGFRSAALWSPRLLAYLAQFAQQPQVADTLRAVLTHWSVDLPAAPN